MKKRQRISLHTPDVRPKTKFGFFSRDKKKDRKSAEKEKSFILEESVPLYEDPAAYRMGHKHQRDLQYNHGHEYFEVCNSISTFSIGSTPHGPNSLAPDSYLEPSKSSTVLQHIPTQAQSVAQNSRPPLSVPSHSHIPTQQGQNPLRSHHSPHQTQQSAGEYVLQGQNPPRSHHSPHQAQHNAGEYVLQGQNLLRSHHSPHQAQHNAGKYVLQVQNSPRSHNSPHQTQSAAQIPTRQMQQKCKGRTPVSHAVMPNRVQRPQDSPRFVMKPSDSPNCLQKEEQRVQNSPLVGINAHRPHRPQDSECADANKPGNWVTDSPSGLPSRVQRPQDPPPKPLHSANSQKRIHLAQAAQPGRVYPYKPTECPTDYPIHRFDSPLHVQNEAYRLEDSQISSVFSVSQDGQLAVYDLQNSSGHLRQQDNTWQSSMVIQEAEERGGRTDSKPRELARTSTYLKPQSILQNNRPNIFSPAPEESNRSHNHLHLEQNAMGPNPLFQVPEEASTIYSYTGIHSQMEEEESSATDTSFMDQVQWPGKPHNASQVQERSNKPLPQLPEEMRETCRPNQLQVRGMINSTPKLPQKPEESGPQNSRSLPISPKEPSGSRNFQPGVTKENNMNFNSLPQEANRAYNPPDTTSRPHNSLPKMPEGMNASAVSPAAESSTTWPQNTPAPPQTGRVHGRDQFRPLITPSERKRVERTTVTMAERQYPAGGRTNTSYDSIFQDASVRMRVQVGFNSGQVRESNIYEEIDDFMQEEERQPRYV